MTVAAPEPMAADHDVQLFLSSVESLDHWLKHASKIRRTGPELLLPAMVICWQGGLRCADRQMSCFGHDTGLAASRLEWSQTDIQASWGIDVMGPNAKLGPLCGLSAFLQQLGR
jgi:hypothetical protein